jgi:hypothetical protein
MSSTALAGADQARHRIGRLADPREVDPGRGRARAERHRLEHHLGDERQRSLGAHDEAAKDLQWGPCIEERAEAVSGRVLDLELPTNALGELRLAPDLVADLGEARGELGLIPREAVLRPGLRGVDRGPRGQNKRHRADGRIRILDDAAAHAARVVRDHPADRREVRARRVGPEPPAVGRQDAVGVAEHGARAHPGEGSLPLDRDPGEVTAHVDEDPVGLPLAVEAGAAGPKHDRHLAIAPVGDHLGDVRRVAGNHHRPGEQAIGARVRGVLDEVDCPREHPVAAQ